MRRARAGKSREGRWDEAEREGKGKGKTTLTGPIIPSSAPQQQRDRGRGTKWFLTCAGKMQGVTASSLHFLHW